MSHGNHMSKNDTCDAEMAQVNPSMIDETH